MKFTTFGGSQKIQQPTKKDKPPIYRWASKLLM